MPKERVKHGALYAHIPMPGADAADGPDVEPYKSVPYRPNMDYPDGTTVHEEASLDVVWNREGEYVQIGIDAPREWWDKLMKAYSEDNSPGLSSFAAYTDVLTRSELNHMIRTLRRARDAAYGSDE